MFFSHLTPHTVASLQGTRIQQLHPAKDSSGLAIANVCFSEGVHYWEIVCPFNTDGVKIGISKQQSPSENFEGHLFEFKTTTQRVVGVLLNFNEQSLQFYLNGNLSTNKGIPKGSLISCPWYPCVRLSQFGNSVYLTMKYEDRSVVEHCEQVQLETQQSQHPNPFFLINKNEIHQLQDRLVSVRNCPLVGQQIPKADLDVLIKMKLVICDYHDQNEIVYLILNEETSQKLKRVRQYLKHHVRKLKEKFESKPQEKEKDQLLQEITQMLPNNEEIVQEEKKDEFEYKYSIELCRIADRIIVQLIEQFEEVRSIESAKMRLQTFVDHPATDNPFKVVEYGKYLQPGSGVKYAYCDNDINNNGTKHSKLILRSEIPAQGQIIPCKSDRYFSLRNQDRLTIYNGEAELFKVIDVDLRQLGPYQKNIKVIDVQQEETPSHIYKILENYIIGETEQLPLYDQTILEKLIRMGFEESDCKEALIQTNNNFDKALDIVSRTTGEWQCKFCTLVNKETNQICEACEGPRPDDSQEEEFLIKQPLQIQQDLVEVDQKEEIHQEFKDKITESTINHVSVIHWDSNNTTFPILVASVHNKNILSIKFISYSQNYLDQFFINEDGYYCVLTNCWSKNKDYSLLLQSETSRQIVETLAPLYSKHCKKLEMNLVDHKAIQLEYEIKAIDSAIWNNRLYVFLMGDQALNIYEITQNSKIELQKQIFIGSDYNLLISKTKCLIYSQSKNLIINSQLNVSEIQEPISNAYIKDNIICYESNTQHKQIEDNSEILENNIIQSEEVQIFQTVTDDVHSQKFQIADNYTHIHVKAVFEGPIEEPKQIPLMNSPLTVSDPQKLPLTVHSFKGASFNDQTFVTQMLFDSNKPFSSNYPNTQFIFRSQFDEIMLVDHVRVKSEITNVFRGFPIGTGLIFTSKEEHELNDTSEFDYFDKQQYEKWKSTHQSLFANQPVGYFEFEGDSKEALCKLEVIRPCKYLMLKPTNFRKTPHDHTAHIQTNSVEIKGFAAYGIEIPKSQIENSTFGTISDCQLLTQLRKRIDLPDKLIVQCQYQGINGYPSNGIIEFDTVFSGDFIIKPYEDQEYKLLKVTVTGKKYNNLYINQLDNLIEEVYQKKPGALSVLNLFMKKESKKVLEIISLSKFILGNVLSQNVNEQVTEFFRHLQQHDEFHDILLQVAQQILNKIEKVVLTESGLEYFLGLLTYTAKFKTQEITDLAIKSLLLALQKLKTIEHKDMFLFSTKYGGPQGQVQIQEIDEKQIEQNGNQKTLICQKDPLSQILIMQLSNKQQIRRFEVNLLGEFEIEKLSLRFQQTSNSVKFRVQVWVDNLVLDQVYDEWTFVQFTDYVHKSANYNNYNCLHIGLNRIRARKLLVQLTLGSDNYYSKQSVQLQIPQNYLTIIPEFYGSLLNAELSPLEITEDFRFKNTLSLGESLYYVYQSDKSILMDSYNVYKKTDLTDHYIVMSTKSLRRNADYLEQAIYKLQSEMQLKEKSNLQTNHLQNLIEQTQLEFLKVAPPRNYENNSNFLTVFSSLLLRMLIAISGTVPDVLEFIKLIISLGDMNGITDLALQFIQKKVKDQIPEEQWNELIIGQFTSQNALKKKLLHQLPIPILESLQKLIELKDDVLYDALVTQLQRIPQQKYTEDGNPDNEKILTLIFEFLINDTKFRLKLLQNALPKCTALQIKNSLNEKILTDIFSRGISQPEKFKFLLEMLLQPRQLESRYTDWAATLQLSDQINKTLQIEKDSLIYISKYIIYFCQIYIKENVEKLSIDNLLLLFDFLTKSVKKVNKLKTRETNKQLTDFEDFLQRQHIQICYPDTINRLIQLLEKSENYLAWNKVLKVILMITPQLQNELQIYQRVIQSYLGCKQKLLMNELLQFTLNLAQQQVQQNQTCSQIIDALLPHLGLNEINHIFIVFSQDVQHIYLNNVNILLKYIGMYLPYQGGKDGIINADSQVIQQLELCQSMIYLLVQSEQTLPQLKESPDLNNLFEWFCLNCYSGKQIHSYAGQLLEWMSESLDQLFELLPCKQYILKQLFKQQYYIDDVITKQYENNQITSYTAFTYTTQILEVIQSQFDKYLTSDDVAQQFQSDIYHYLINKIIQEKQITQVQFLEEEFGNKMKVFNLPGQNVSNQDWPLHKKGAKSRLALITLPQGMRSEYQMVFQFDNEIEIKNIRLGIQTFTADFTDKQLGTPSSILLEVGKSLEELYPIAEMQLVNDEHYSQYQVKVFCYNSQVMNKQQLPSGQSVKFISFRMRQQYVEQLDTTRTMKKLCLGISFISVIGYSAIRQKVDFIYTLQEKTAIEILSKFCKPNYQKTLQQLANDSIVLEQLQNNIDKFMNALNSYSFQLSPLILAIAKYNHQVGDWLVMKLMEYPEQSHSKLLSQIILEGEHVHERFLKLHNHLFEKLLALQINNHQQQDLLWYEKLAQHFIESYCNVLLLQNSKLKQRELSLNINKNDIIHLIELFQLMHNKHARHLLIKLIVTITYLPHPYQQIEEVEQILQFTLDKSRTQPYFLEVLGPLSLGNKVSIGWIVNQLDQIFDKFDLNSVIPFFYTLSTNKKIADHLLKYLLPLYHLLIEEPTSKTILKQLDDKTIETVAKFISYMVQKYHAKFIIEALIRDIGRLEGNKDMKFVRSLLVPILNSEDYVFLKIQFEDQGRYILDPKLIAQKRIDNTQKQDEVVFESQLLTIKQKDQLFAHLTETYWNKVAYQKNDGDSDILPHLEDKFFNSTPQMMVINYKINNTDKTIILYHNEKCIKQDKSDLAYSWNQGKLKVYYFNENNLIVNEEIDLNAFIEIYDEQGTLTFQNNDKAFLELEYVAGEPSRINLTSLNLKDQGIIDNLKIEYYVSGVRPQKQKKALPQINIPQETISQIFPNYETNQSLQYYSAVPVYQLPSQLKLNELKQLIVFNKYGLKQECNIFEKQTKLCELPTNELNIIELEVNARDFIDNIQPKTLTFTYPQQLTIFPLFEEMNGVNAMLSVIREGIGLWKNQQRANAWLQFLNELQSFCQLPNFFNLFMKNQLCVNLLFDLIAGPPDSNNQKLEEEEQNAVKFIYTTLVSVFSASSGPEVRIKALEQNLIKQILDRIALVSKETKRVFRNVLEKQVVQESPQKNNTLQKSTKQKRGVGYASDNTGQNQKWNTIEYVEKKTQKSQQLIGLLGIVESFFDFQHWHPSEDLLHKLKNTLFESALLPLLESAFRSGSLLEISKEFDLYCKYLKIVQSMSHHKVLAGVFLKIPEQYYPPQTQSLFELLSALADTSKIFMNCIQNNRKKNEEEEHSFEIAKMIIDTHKRMENCINKMNDSGSSSNEEDETEQLKKQKELANELIQQILSKQLPEAYRTLLSDLRFNYIDMKVGGRYKHHYSGNISTQINQDKIVRLAQEFADMSTSLPIEHTNAIFVRADKERVDVMKALVMGAKGTPYGHGAFLFDIYADDSYPNAPPKMNLSTTGNGKVRFNPNLYSCGKVCLSLLGTWRGNASENWDPKISTLLQVLVSTQAIIMSEEVYFNEPGSEQEANTDEGEKRNEGYSNIVRYCNIKYAMIDQIRDPPKGFETIIKRHFYLKKQEILEECNKWVELADTKEALYTGLLNDHNSSWCSEFKKSKKAYHKKLSEAVKELEEELNKIQPPSAADLEGSRVLRTHVKKQPKVKNLKEGMANLDEVDVTYTKIQQKEFEANDENVLDRWSRYIGAMGMDAVKKQANSCVLVSGIGALGIEVAKNIVLSGVKMLTIHDQQKSTQFDLNGQFFIEEKDIGKNRAEVSWEKLQQLNSYVRVNYETSELLNIDFTKYNIVVVCATYPNDVLFKLSTLCRQHKVKLIISSVDGVFGRVFNDFGQSFIVEDKNGEQTVDYIVKSVTDKGENKLHFEITGKHEFQDNDVVMIDNIEGMIDSNGNSINKTIQKVKVISKSILEIQLNGYSKYIRNGTIKLVKVPVELSFHPYNQEFIDKPIYDPNMSEYDFIKLQNTEQLHSLYNNKQIKDENFELLFKHYSILGEFSPLSAYLGGFVSQEAIKGITNKFTPVQQLFYVDCTEVLQKEISKDVKVSERSLSRFLGTEIAEKLEKSKIFMVGCGAIGCELLKNFAMLNLGIKGSITITDPDHIEVSNLNRQFLFREKHLRKPKSQTAAAAVIQMNPYLRDHIIARLDKVHDSTEHIYTDQFFEDQDIIANALDNVAARRYVDKRCVNSRKPLLESGTLGPKGHVQCIVPFQTESYGSSNDPVEEGEIPYCTLKMFPEETFHCVEFARDKFGKHFSARPKQLIKMMAEDYIPQFRRQQTFQERLSNCLRTNQTPLKIALSGQEESSRNTSLMTSNNQYVKTKDGNLFWTMPKRPPKPIQFDPENEIHQQFVSTFAFLRAKMFSLQTDKDWRTKTYRQSVAKQANLITFPEWQPSEEKKKSISDKVKEQGQKEEPEENETTQTQSTQEETQLLFKQFKSLLPITLASDEFEKDNDQNGHIDFIHSFGNLRAANYKLEPMDWLTVKIKAGRIVPALATTTAVVAGLQTIELIKTLKNVQISDMKNAFVNLAIPFVKLTEPGLVPKKKINEKVTVTLWDIWTQEITKQTTFRQLFEILNQQYDLHPRDVFLKAQPVYMEIMYAKKAEEKKHFLGPSNHQSIRNTEICWI
ncbi:unnamed protein product (macronuclear) [Paramecium tetraurelia]|uniref:UBA domain-containing protein n=1 Tax=Paramecium tetraurelia TaxID=5888 RepID=A0CMC8_PARTE|nr:uncharacterized protein GSPATT00008424001 [Paramecium tetraurelia]CAK71945.1 unnamed protein product [Paramecium tetraurelia]|eukprot:XP_001439342.1 hypothetical protein (macronuclear) [Paramecium tetraurelia strain d4-2]